MSWRRSCQRLKKLSVAEKSILIGFFTGVVFTFTDCFYQINSNSLVGNLDLEGNMTIFNAYQGIASVLTYFYTFFSLTLVLITFSSVNNAFFKRLLEKYYWLSLLLAGQSTFLVFLSYLIYFNYAQQFVRAGIKYGLTITLLSSIWGFLAAYYHFWQQHKIDQQKRFMAQMQSNLNLCAEDVDSCRSTSPSQMSLGDYLK